MAKEKEITLDSEEISTEDFKKEVLADYKLANVSRETSLLGRREVLTGKAKFGIFGDGKEVAQLAMAKQFKDGDFRSGYYRDQTFMMAIGQLTVEQFFAQLYAHTDLESDPSSAGRQMNAHFATRSLNDDGTWKDLTKQKNSSADVSPTGSQMPRLLGLAYASKIYRENKNLKEQSKLFSINGNEVAFGTIGDASTSEGMFWETLNAAGVVQVPMALSVWDDGYGISVPKKYQTTKESISELTKGFQRTKSQPGYEIFTVKGWDYQALVETYQKAIAICRKEHVPVLIHVEEITQPQGHSTSGSHERYKSKERLEWAKEYDCIVKMREWLLSLKHPDTSASLITAEELDQIEEQAKKEVRQAKAAAWKAYITPIKEEISEVISLLDSLIIESGNAEELKPINNNLKELSEPLHRDVVPAVKKALRITSGENTDTRRQLVDWLNEANAANHDRYNSYLYSNSSQSALNINEVKPQYDDNAEDADGRILLRDNFDNILKEAPETLIFGEDSGKIGGVNQGLEGLQALHGELKVFDTGIRETTIVGQGIGMAMRGLRPIAEIQYLDYLLYCLQIISDDLATVQYRTKGGQKAPLIIRTRGHRLEGIWHSGSPMGMIIHGVRGIYVCVPRDMTRAVGFYNTLLESDEPGLIIEPLNGYRLKEKYPSNLNDIKVPVGVPEVIREGADVTLITYGSNCRIAIEAVEQLQDKGISVEVIDVQTLLPFDINHTIVESVKKTGALVCLDEDVPGGASAFMLQKVLEEQKGYYYLDSEPVTIAAKEHRPAYGSDGDYFSKPNAEDIFDRIYELMNERDPGRFPPLY